MTDVWGGGYLSGLPDDQRDELARVNAPGLTALREYLASGEAVAFLGAGVSAPLYPLWDGLIPDLVDAAASKLTTNEAPTPCSTRPRAPTVAGAPRPRPGMPGWCRRAWILTR